MKNFLKLLGMLVMVISLASCSKSSRHEDRIVTDLNEIFDPENETYTDWNRTEVDDDLMEAFGLYYDPDIRAYRQKYQYYANENDVTHKKERRGKPLNPITGHLILMVLLLVAGEGYLLYATYVQAKKLHRIVWMWMVNCFMGGLASFVVLSLSRPLEYDADLDIRQEPDLLGTATFVVNLYIVLVIAIAVHLYFAIMRNPDIATEFFQPKYW